MSPVMTHPATVTTAVAAAAGKTHRIHQSAPTGRPRVRARQPHVGH